MKRIYLLAYITILCCLCPLLKAQLGPMPFTPVPPNDPSLVRLLNSDVRCRQWVDSVMQRLTLKERIGQLFIYTIAPQQDKANKELLRKVVEDYKVGGLLFSGGLMQNQVMLTNEAQRMAEVPLMITFDGEWGLAMRLRGTPNFPRNMVLGCIQNDTLIYEYGREVARQCLVEKNGKCHTYCMGNRWKSCAGRNPSAAASAVCGRDHLPVVFISWYYSAFTAPSY